MTTDSPINSISIKDPVKIHFGPFITWAFRSANLILVSRYFRSSLYSLLLAVILRRTRFTPPSALSFRKIFALSLAPVNWQASFCNRRVVRVVYARYVDQTRPQAVSSQSFNGIKFGLSNSAKPAFCRTISFE
jgi:hypothetical protein